MAEWWYHIIHKCPGCGATWDEYDPKGGGYDSGLNSCPTIKEMCDECCEADYEKEQAGGEPWLRHAGVRRTKS